MNSDNSPSTEEQVHRGYDPESGLLTRLREWTDVFPWLRLGRTLRVAGSPPLIFLVAVTLTIWKIGIWLLPFPEAIPHVHLADAGWNTLEPAAIASHVQGLNPTSVFNGNEEFIWWKTLLVILWSVLVWTPTVIVLTRQGGLLTAGRPLMSIRSVITLGLTRMWPGWMAALVPLGCVSALSLLILTIGWIASLIGDVSWINTIFSIATVAIAIPCGILAFGANAAIPLSWAALGNERDPDALDCLSRGYEYLFRRPLQLVLYLTVSLVIVGVVVLLAIGVTEAATHVCNRVLGLCEAPENMIATTGKLLSHLPVVVLLTAMWGLVGGVYLLLRYDAGGQEVEDLWQPEPTPVPPLPSIPGQPSSDASSDESS